MGNIYIGVDGISRKIKNAYIGVDGIARRIKQFYIGDENGVAKLVYSGGGYAFIKNINNLSYIVKADSTLTENSSTQLSTYFSNGGYLYKTGTGYCAVGAPSTNTGNTIIYSINDLANLTLRYETGYSFDIMDRFFADDDMQIVVPSATGNFMFYSTDNFINYTHGTLDVGAGTLSKNISYNNGKIAYAINNNNTSYGRTFDLGGSTGSDIYIRNTSSSTCSVGNGVTVWATQDRYSVVYNHSTGTTTRTQNLPLLGLGYVSTNNTFYQCFVNGMHMLIQNNTHDNTSYIGVFSSVDGTSWNSVRTYDYINTSTNLTAGFSGNTFYICTYNSTSNTTIIALTTDCGVTWNEYTVTGMVRTIAEMQ